MLHKNFYPVKINNRQIITLNIKKGYYKLLINFDSEKFGKIVATININYKL